MLTLSPWTFADAGRTNLKKGIAESRSSKFSTQVYAESYTNPTQSGYVHFQRVREYVEHDYLVHPYIGIENNIDSQEQNTVGELGFDYRTGFGLLLNAGLRRERINTREKTISNARLGLIYGKFFRIPIWNLFADFYGEAFFLNPEGDKSYASGSLVGKFGYRLVEKNGWSWDPAVSSLRLSDNTFRRYAGADYRMVILSTQGSYYYAPLNSSASLMIGKAWTHSQTVSPRNDYWILFALGGRF